jgi:hypothetical protein
MKRIALAVLALSFLAVPALAQNTAKTKPTPAPVKKVKQITIEAIDVDGDRVTKPLEPISVDEAAKSTSLIRIRRDFIDLIVKQGESI